MKKVIYLGSDGVYREVEVYEASDFVASSGPSSANKPVLVSPSGQIDPSLIPSTGISVDAAKEIDSIFILGEDISALKLVFVDGDGLLYIAKYDEDYKQAQAIGITKTSGVTGQGVNVLLFGKLEDPFFNFTPAVDLFLGANGTITEIAPTSGFFTKIGKSLETGSIFLNIETTITL